MSAPTRRPHSPARRPAARGPESRRGTGTGAPPSMVATPPTDAVRTDAPAWDPHARTTPPLRRELLLLLAVVAGGLFLRGLVAQRGLWLDETITYTQIHGLSVSEVIERQFNGVHPPLFHVLMHYWTGLFGDSPLGMRSLSMVWSAVGIGAVWAWSKEAMPLRSGIPAAAFAAFSPFAVWYGTEARMYAQLFALAAVASWLVWRILARGATPARVAGLAVAAIALGFTHYFSLLVIGSLGLVALSRLPREDARRRALAVGAALTAAIVLLGIWGLVVATHRTAEPLTTVFARPDFFTIVIAGIEMVFGFHDYVSLGVAAAAWPLLILFLIATLPHLGKAHWRTGGLALCAGLPIAALVAAALLRSSSVFDSRYLTVTVPALYVLGGRLFLAIGSAHVRRGLAVVAIAGAALITVRQNYDPGNPRLYGLRDAIRTINANARPGDGAILIPEVLELNGTDPILGYYPLSPGVKAYNSTPDGQAGTISPQAMFTRLRETFPRRLWVVYGYDALSYSGGGDARTGDTSGSELAKQYDDFLQSKGYAITSVRYPNVTLTAYKLDWKGER